MTKRSLFDYIFIDKLDYKKESPWKSEAFFKDEIASIETEPKGFRFLALHCNRKILLQI